MAVILSRFRERSAQRPIRFASSSGNLLASVYMDRAVSLANSKTFAS